MREGRTFLTYLGTDLGTISFKEWTDASHIGHFSSTFTPYPPSVTIPFRASSHSGSLKHEGLNAGRYWTTTGSCFKSIGGFVACNLHIPKYPEGDGTATVGSTLVSAWNVAANTADDPQSNGAPNGNGCQTFDRTVFWRGCFTSYTIRDDDEYSDYTAQTLIGYGHADVNDDRAWVLLSGGEQINYTRGYVINASPNGRTDGGGPCHPINYGISLWGVTLSGSSPACDDYLNGNISDSGRVYDLKWHGKWGDMDNNAGNGGAVAGAYDEGKTSGGVFSITGSYCDFHAQGCWG